MGIVRDVRNKLYKKVLTLPLSFYTEERKGDIISKMTNDVTEVEISVVGSLEMLFRDPVLITFYLGSLIFISWELTLATFLILSSE